MTTAELEVTLQQLCNLKAETEVVEFKEAKNEFDFTKLGKYFSALSNEANLMDIPCAWLVFGIENKLHKIVGNQYCKSYRGYALSKREKSIENQGTIRYPLWKLRINRLDEL
jgi:ATP-dependent DNA helicase RecG